MFEYDYLFKILLVGDSGVGKTCLLLKYTDDIYIGRYISTIGVDFKITTVKIGKYIVKLQIWDTAGQERFRTITSSYYKGANAAGIVFDLTDPESFTHVLSWVAEIKRYALQNVHILIIGTKSDLPRAISMDEITEFVDAHNFQYIETSAKSGIGVYAAFEKISTDLVNHVTLQKSMQDSIHFTNTADVHNTKCC